MLWSIAYPFGMLSIHPFEARGGHHARRLQPVLSVAVKICLHVKPASPLRGGLWPALTRKFLPAVVVYRLETALSVAVGEEVIDT